MFWFFGFFFFLHVSHNLQNGGIKIFNISMCRHFLHYKNTNFTGPGNKIFRYDAVLHRPTSASKRERLCM